MLLFSQRPMQLGQTMSDPTSKLLQAGCGFLLGFLLPSRETVFVLWETIREIRGTVPGWGAWFFREFPVSVRDCG
jgi:hypothetical protein